MRSSFSSVNQCNKCFYVSKFHFKQQTMCVCVFMKRMTCAPRRVKPGSTQTHARTHKRAREHSHYLASCQVELNNDVVVSGGSLLHSLHPQAASKTAPSAASILPASTAAANTRTTTKFCNSPRRLQASRMMQVRQHRWAFSAQTTAEL